MTGTGRQTIVIGLDGVPPWLLDRLIEEGAMPCLAELREIGSYGRMQSSINMMTPSAWTSMVTGVDPGRHGLFNFLRYRPEHHEITISTSIDREVGAIWDLLGAEEKQSAILRVPMTFPAREMQGITVCDHLAPSPLHPRFTWPQALRKKIVLRFGALGWVQEPITEPLTSRKQVRRFIQKLHDGVQRAFDLIDYAIDRNEFSLVFAVISQTDTLLHRLVPVFAPERAGAASNADIPEGTREAATGVFQQVDRNLRRLVDRVGGESNLLLVSDHGMGSTQPGPQNLLRPLLIELGYLGWDEPSEPLDRSIPARLRRAKSSLAAMLPWQLRRLLLPFTHRARAEGAQKATLESVVWDRTDALVLMPNPVEEIWLNLQKRSPQGRVAPGERQAVLDELKHVLSEATNGESGAPVVAAVLEREECVQGPFADRVGDLLVVFKQDAPCEDLAARRPDGRTGHVTSASPGGWDVPYPGHHEPWGFIAAHGPEIARGRADLECDVTDIMPTLAYLLRGRVPEGLDGSLLRELIAADALASQPPESGRPVPRPGDAPKYKYTQGERAQVEDRLKDLGYL